MADIQLKKKEIIKKRFNAREVENIHEEIRKCYLDGKTNTEIIDFLISKYGLAIRSAEYEIEKAWEKHILPMYERDFVILTNKNLKRYEEIYQALLKHQDYYIEHPKKKQDFAFNEDIKRKNKKLLQALKQKERLVGHWSENETTIINNDIRLNYHVPKVEKKAELNLEAMEREDLAKMLEILKSAKIDLQTQNLNLGAGAVDTPFEEIKS